MSDFDHKVGVSEANLVIRTLKLTGMNESNNEVILTEINATFGVDAVSYNKEDKMLHLAYDATNINLDGIEDILRKYDADVSGSWWNHIKEDYYKFVDQNVKDNANHKPWSCHKSPPGAGKK
ncbi:MAG: hypothetical protein COB83_03010 [Gammaproteobacteria bacterium]|nr:MAG: hypothetical protein COB83_03010 [Gammaproteobacteria bacterium]